MTGSRVYPGCGGGSAQDRAPEGKLDRSSLSVSIMSCQEISCGAIQRHQSTRSSWAVAVSGRIAGASGSMRTVSSTSSAFTSF